MPQKNFGHLRRESDTNLGRIDYKETKSMNINSVVCRKKKLIKNYEFEKK